VSETTPTKIRCEASHDGALRRLTLNAPKGNVLDERMVRELDDAFRTAAADKRVKAILLCADGPHFSFGASVEEHMPEKVRDMLTGFHALFRRMAASGIPVVAAVQGVCVGGGLELAAFCHRVFAHPEASMGQPEIKLGVIAPVASLILAERVGRGAADELLLTGRSVDAHEALAMGLVDHVDADPVAAAEAWVMEYLLPLSASSLRFATRAGRLEFTQRFERILPELEELYLGQLMESHDAVEGITAFLEKREPVWLNE
jgi:cyclohexa-1,5-dienecarbonyl-CoA hydratase